MFNEMEVELKSGYYMVWIRYAGALNQAYRTFRIGDSTEYNMYFPGTGSWNDWKNVVLQKSGGAILKFYLSQQQAVKHLRDFTKHLENEEIQQHAAEEVKSALLFIVEKLIGIIESLNEIFISWPAYTNFAILHAA